MPPPPWVVGHRGAAGEAPENTLPSIRRAMEQRADMVEIDLQLTADGELVAFHDWDLRRLAGRAGAVEELPGAAVAGLEVGDGGGRAPIPTLAQVLAAVSRQVPLNLELKRRRADRRAFARALAAALEGRGTVLLSSFDWELLGVVRRQLPAHPVAPIADRDPRGLLEAGETLGALTLHCHRRLARRRSLLEGARSAGRPLLAYTVNGPREARRLFARGVSGVFSDFPGRLRRRLGTRT